MDFLKLILLFSCASCAYNAKRVTVKNFKNDALLKETISRVSEKNLNKLGSTEQKFAKCFKGEGALYMEPSLEKRSKDFNYWNQIGSCYLVGDELEKGFYYLNLAESFVKNNRQKARVYNNYGYYYYKSGRIKTALQYFQKSVKLDSRFKSPIYNQALIYLSSGRRQSFRQKIGRLISRNPSDKGLSELKDFGLKNNKDIELLLTSK